MFKNVDPTFKHTHTISNSFGWPSFQTFTSYTLAGTQYTGSDYFILFIESFVTLEWEIWVATKSKVYKYF